MADAGRFMTKWLMVCGIVRMVGGAVGEVGLEANGRFAGMEMVFWFVVVRSRIESTAWWMKVWPSSLKGRTKWLTWRELVIY